MKRWETAESFDRRSELERRNLIRWQIKALQARLSHLPKNFHPSTVKERFTIRSKIRFLYRQLGDQPLKELGP